MSKGIIIRIGAAYDEIRIKVKGHTTVIDRAELRKQGKRGRHIIRQAEKSISKHYA